MNIKMVTTLPIEEVPNKISDYMSEINKRLLASSESIKECVKNIKEKNDLLRQVEIIQNVRNHLVLVDANLDDCYSILKGYVKHQIDPLPETSQEEIEKIMEGMEGMEDDQQL